MNWFFIVGCPRSGTTLLQQALNRHPAVVVPPETAFFTFLRQPLRRQVSHLRRIEHDLGIRMPPLTARLSGTRAARSFYEQLADRYLSRIGRTAVTHFGEKSPEHLRRYRLIRRVFPDAKCVLLYRDGRDVALSLSKVPWMPGDLEVGFALWLHYARVAARLARAFGDDLYQVKYERMVEDPVRELAGVCRFLGLDFRPEMALGSGNSEGVPGWERGWKERALAPIDSNRVGVWRAEMSDRQVGILERWGGGTLAAMGYELVTGGTRRLPPLFYPRVYARALRWLLTRPAYGEVDYLRAGGRRPAAAAGAPLGEAADE